MLANVHPHCLALTILATTAVVVALEWAQGFLIPLLIGILLAYTLNPLIVWLELIKVPRPLGTSLVMLAVVCGLVFGIYSLRGQMQAIIEQLPEAANQLSRGMAKLGEEHLGAMQKVQSAANQLEQAVPYRVIIFQDGAILCSWPERFWRSLLRRTAMS